jgi:hypothetical protein
MEATMLDLPRFCVSCGQPPTEKNREHVLPQWLIELTGHPKRVVNFGANPITGKQPRFDWSSFAFPACYSCNERYSHLESAAKPILICLLDRSPLTGYEVLQLLDWLDKIRIGLWLGYLYLHKNPGDIYPRFHIESRVGLKDRMVAVYFMDTERKGLGAYGAETLSFQLFPSCFSLNINNLHILNMSWDFMCSARCGFPFPRQKVIDLDQDRMLECSDFVATRKPKWPISIQSLIKPVLQIYQPIMQVLGYDLPELSLDPWLKKYLVPGSNSEGLPVRQRGGSVELLSNLATSIEYDEVKGKSSKPLKDIIAQTYDLQIASTKAFVYRSSKPEDLSNMDRLLSLARKATGRIKNAFARLDQEAYNAAFVQSEKGERGLRNN